MMWLATKCTKERQQRWWLQCAVCYTNNYNEPSFFLK
jgi:hypothetical protein